jgi:hypothetical protein
MMGPVWVAFLLAVLAVPTAPALDTSLSFAIDLAGSLVESKPQVEYARSSRLGKEIV